jgi:hypothetical protein
MMTREEVLAEMETSFAEMTDDLKSTVLFTDEGKEWTPTLLLEEVRNDTETGKSYVIAWSQNKGIQQMEDLLSALLAPPGPEYAGRPEIDDVRAGLLNAILGPPDPNAMTCGLPDCQHCHGEVRPFDQKE